MVSTTRSTRSSASASTSASPISQASSSLPKTRAKAKPAPAGERGKSKVGSGKDKCARCPGESVKRKSDTDAETQKDSAKETWIECDACQEWYHWACVAPNPLDPIDIIDKVRYAFDTRFDCSPEAYVLLPLSGTARGARWPHLGSKPHSVSRLAKATARQLK